MSSTARRRNGEAAREYTERESAREYTQRECRVSADAYTRMWRDTERASEREYATEWAVCRGCGAG